ncbi:membrane-targeted effector domain-containing toxin [Pseudomonas fluorescens]|uniref:membrane-targeted effector domain-containing toxin n=1 Tax=Pseudomonas fluorescens TaxID=294 RepID=UPI00177D874D|nr:membrane-targeted effector domain-containing toxin [Pseudomonas fluorescens]MBD8236886.1 membrane-targeted effector domain-containing toxin [Pseudomonas fluorescens]MDY0896297.1 membrane-targeted effector domain-containing toxin [Pseudomonas fluorescens]
MNSLSTSPRIFPQPTPFLLELAPTQSSSLHLTAQTEQVQPDGRQALKDRLGDRRDVRTLAQALHTAAEKLGEDATPEALAAYLRSTHLPLDPDTAGASARTANLESLIRATCAYMPKTWKELKNTALALSDHTLQHPLGNFGGALSWALPLSVEHQRTVYDVVACNSANLPGLPLTSARAGALDYLTDAVTLSPTALQDPAAALEQLLDTPRAAALGAAIQASVGGIATDSSVNDYVLAAIHLGLDSEALEQPERNKVAGFDLAAERHWGHSPAAVVDALANHLSSSGRTASATAPLAARLLLTRVAPQFLVKDIPATVVYGSQAWAHLCLAVAGIEADTPGKSVHMSFSEVMLAAGQTSETSEATKKAVLIDWSVANQVLPRADEALYSTEDIEEARSVFNTQHEALKEASGLLDAPLPNRKEMALALLKKTFGDKPWFEEKNLCFMPNFLLVGRTATYYSLVDIVMQGLKINAHDWRFVPARDDTNLQAVVRFTNSASFNVPSEFDKEFTAVTSQYKKIKHYALMNAITLLPSADRDILNKAKLGFYKENSYRISALPLVKDTLFHTSPKILMQADHNGEKHVYEFDTTTSTIKKVARSRIGPDQPGPSEVTKIEAFPVGAALSELETAQTRGDAEANTFTNSRIRQIAQAVVNAEGIDSDAVKRQAAGRTSAEQTRDTLDAVGEFLLDLVPLRSAIVNFRAGHYKDAAGDLAFDIFGFITAGIATVAKVAKGASTVASTLAKVARGTRIIGVNALSAFNPLSGVGDVAVGAGKLALVSVSTAGEGIHRLKGMLRGSDLIEASRGFDDAAIGVFTQGGRRLEGSAVLHDGKWYAADTHSRQPYGPPLDTFNPSDTLAPTHTTTPKSTDGVRHNPLDRSARRPPLKQVPLPAGSYVESMKGRLEPGHFLRGNGKDETFKKFLEEMHQTYNALKHGGLPPRPSIPAIPKPVPAKDLITEALKVSDGIVFGESHREMASFKTLFDNVDTFKQQGVKKVYFEGVIDLPGKGVVDDGIGNLGAANTPRTRPTFKELKAKLELNGIEVLPLDHYYLTRHKDARLGLTQAGSGSVRRLEEFNYYASEVIKANSGTEKWVALVGHSHMKTSEGVPGLAEMTGSIGIGVFQNRPRQVSVGFRDTVNVPNPQKPLSGTDRPGDLHIYA